MYELYRQYSPYILIPLFIIAVFYYSLVTASIRKTERDKQIK